MMLPSILWNFKWSYPPPIHHPRIFMSNTIPRSNGDDYCQKLKQVQTINTQLKICKSDFNVCQKSLLAAKDESKTYLVKIEETRLKRVKAARKERSWKALDDWLLQQLRMKKRTCKELWAALPEKGDNYQFYRKDEKICCRSKSRKSIKFRAFS
jgi:hypothetical protein